MDSNHHWRELGSKSEIELQSCASALTLCSNRESWGLLLEEVGEHLFASFGVGDFSVVGLFACILHSGLEGFNTGNEFVDSRGRKGTREFTSGPRTHDDIFMEDLNLSRVFLGGLVLDEGLRNLLGTYSLGYLSDVCSGARVKGPLFRRVENRECL